ncbi:MAG: HD domain-containing protein [Spirochaetales bacterium]|nr:HD domain-containing protein [Spirochaetales bacterium]
MADWACYSVQGKRLNDEKVRTRKKVNIRPVFSHDADRIIHSRAYSRYIDKTQVFYQFENDHITHRVLHVQFVSKIARSLGRSLKLNEDLIEAIALGHDLGHAPYGHDGESILNELCQNSGTGHFSHNAQSVRLLMEMEKGGKGLNLTVQVLDGILAHNGEVLNRVYEPDYGKKPETFLMEYKKCFSEPDYGKHIIPMTLEACVVRISDIIAYIGRDIEDAVILKVIKRSDIPDSIRSEIGDTNSEIIDALATDLLINSYGKRRIEFSDKIFSALKELMDFNYKQIYRHPLLKSQSGKIENMYRSLFEICLDDIIEKRNETLIRKNFLARMSEKYLSETDDSRKVIDYLSGMTDDYFNNQYRSCFLPERMGYSL